MSRIDESFEMFPTANGSLPDLSRILGLPDFDWAARQSMNSSAYTRYRHGSGGEWSYRNNLEVFERYRFRPRVMVDASDIESSMEFAFPVLMRSQVKNAKYSPGLLFLVISFLHPSLSAHAPLQVSLMLRARLAFLRRQRSRIFSTSYVSCPLLRYTR